MSRKYNYKNQHYKNKRTKQIETPQYTGDNWTAEEEDEIGDCGYKEWYVSVGNGTQICAQICNPHDASLIEAAPEMYGYLKHFYDTTTALIIGEKSYKALGDILAKAEGRS